LPGTRVLRAVAPGYTTLEAATMTDATLRVPTLRTADPYRDTHVIDARAPRFNQAFVGTLSLVAIVTGWWPLLALLAAQLAIGLFVGRRYCLPCVFYFEVVQPRFGEGPLEDSRPPRFANFVGLLVLSAASLAFVAGFPLVGTALGALVAGLALLAATTGFCLGCWMYRVAAPLLGVHLLHLEPAAICADCAVPPEKDGKC
jgi:hypothetical protein